MHTIVIALAIVGGVNMALLILSLIRAFFKTEKLTLRQQWYMDEWTDEPEYIGIVPTKRKRGTATKSSNKKGGKKK